jgi:drug/metabolite transporter (DMT)-like permease
MKFLKAGPLVLALVAALLFGISTPISKLLLRDVNAFLLAGLLYLGAALGLLPFVIRGRRKAAPQSQALRLNRKNGHYVAAMILFGGFLGPVLLFLGLQSALSASVSLWLNLEMVFTTILGILFFREHLGLRGWIAVAVALAAGVLLSLPQGAGGFQAALLIAGACLCWAIDNHVTALIDGMTPQQSTTLKGLVAGTVNLAIGLLLSRSVPSITDVLPALVLGFVAYGLSITFYIMAAQAMGAVRSQLLFSLAPYFGIGLAVLLLGEGLDWAQVAAALAMGAAGVLLVWDKHAHPHAHPAESHIHRHSHGDAHHNHDHPGLPPETVHTHQHEHEPLEHSHQHWPDLHHRHRHEG